jgi:hypothetical protein
VVFTILRGKDVGGVQHYDPNHANNMDTLNSTGNFETIPPYTNGADSYPLGRVLRGRTATWYPDKMMDAMIDAQGQQTILAIDTSWLLVGRRQSLSFMKASTPHCFIMLVTVPRRREVFSAGSKDGGNGATALFWERLGATTIDVVLSNTAPMNKTPPPISGAGRRHGRHRPDRRRDRQGPHHAQASSKSVAHLPHVNGIALSDKAVLRSRTVRTGHRRQRPSAAFEASMMTGITVYRVEDWDLSTPWTQDPLCNERRPRGGRRKHGGRAENEYRLGKGRASPPPRRRARRPGSARASGAVLAPSDVPRRAGTAGAIAQAQDDPADFDDVAAPVDGCLSSMCSGRRGDGGAAAGDMGPRALCPSWRSSFSPPSLARSLARCLARQRAPIGALGFCTTPAPSPWCRRFLPSASRRAALRASVEAQDAWHARHHRQDRGSQSLPTRPATRGVGRDGRMP